MCSSVVEQANHRTAGRLKGQAENEPTPNGNGHRPCCVVSTELTEAVKAASKVYAQTFSAPILSRPLGRPKVDGTQPLRCAIDGAAIHHARDYAHVRLQYFPRRLRHLY